MSRQIDQGGDPETLTRIFVRNGSDAIELVMPPMDEEAKLAKLRCARYLLDMTIKYGPALKAEEKASSIPI